MTWPVIDPSGYLERLDFRALRDLNRDILSNRPKRKRPSPDPWIAAFSYTNTTPTEFKLGGTKLHVHDPNQPVLIEARHFGAQAAGVAASFAFVVWVVGVGRTLRRYEPLSRLEDD